MKINNEDILEIDEVRSTLDMGASFTSKPIYLGHISDYSIQLIFTGSPVGSFSLQVSNDAGRISANSEANQYAGVSNWTDLMGSSQSITASGDHTWVAKGAGYLWVRVVYTRVSGSGTLTSARANLKGV